MPNLPSSEKKTVLMAYEESIGFMCGTEVLDKDGISACVRAAELISYLSQIGQTLTDKLGRFIQHVMIVYFRI